MSNNNDDYPADNANESAQPSASSGGIFGGGIFKQDTAAESPDAYRNSLGQAPEGQSSGRASDIWDLLVGITPDKLFNTVFSAADEALEATWTASADIVGKTIKGAFSNDSPEVPVTPNQHKGGATDKSGMKR